MPSCPARARALLWVSSALAEWAIAVGIEPSPEVLFNEATIERHLRGLIGKASESSRRTRRANLRYLAGTLGLRLHPQPSPISRSGPAKPYSQDEIAEYLLLARHQSLARRRSIEALICLGAGAGLDGQDLRHLTGANVVVRSGGVLVVIEKGRRRVVPVLERYGDMALSCAAYFGDSYMTGGRCPTRKNVTTPVLERTRGGVTLERLSVSRLRSTWLYEQLERLCLNAFLRAAGVRSSQRLFELAAYLPEVEEHDLVLLLGGSHS